MIAKSGDVSMFLVDWFTRFVSIGGVLMSGSPQKKNFALSSRAEGGRRAAAHGRLCPGIDTSRPLLRLPLSSDAFSAGKTAMMLMWTTIAGPVYNPKTSKVANSVAVSVCPGIGVAAARSSAGLGMGP
jgi:hypothetical protein